VGRDHLADPSGLCPSAQTLYKAFSNCVCAESCTAACNATFCSSQAADMGCQQCIDAACAAQRSACLADM